MASRQRWLLGRGEANSQSIHVIYSVLKDFGLGRMRLEFFMKRFRTKLFGDFEKC